MQIRLKSMQLRLIPRIRRPVQTLEKDVESRQDAWFKAQLARRTQMY